jgi:hypothetical protein
MYAGVVLAGGVVLSQGVEIRAVELPVAHRDPVQHAEIGGGLRAAVLFAQVAGDAVAGPRHLPGAGYVWVVHPDMH